MKKEKYVDFLFFTIIAKNVILNQPFYYYFFSLQKFRFVHMKAIADDKVLEEAVFLHFLLFPHCSRKPFLIKL